MEGSNEPRSLRLVFRTKKHRNYSAYTERKNALDTQHDGGSLSVALLSGYSE